jgi:ADP-ribosyl-[dinitrogen reductase] hydrolase
VSVARQGPTERERYRGVLLGLACGDALGAPADYLSPEQIAGRWGVLAEMVGGGCHDVAAGEATDATDMTLCLAESLADRGEFDPEDVVRRYLEWFSSCPKDVNLTMRTALLSIRSGISLDMASRRAHEILGSPSAGNGSLSRCSPIALLYRHDREIIRDVSLRESGLTDFDRLAGWVCAAYNELIDAALDGKLRSRVLGVAAEFGEEDARVTAVINEAVIAEPEEIYSSANALDTLRAAVWCTVHARSFEEAVVTAVNLGNDADTTGAVTGALAGAHFGEGSIPPRWLEVMPVRSRAAALADRLADLAGVP